MKLKLVRNTKTDNSTIGKLYVDQIFECFTLEDRERTIKVLGQTCIPKGTYRVVLNYSKRFKKVMPLLEGVPNFEGIRIHIGNEAGDTKGCILVGTSEGIDFIGNSRVAYMFLMKKLQRAFYDNGEPITIEVTD